MFLRTSLFRKAKRIETMQLAHQEWTNNYKLLKNKLGGSYTSDNYDSVFNNCPQLKVWCFGQKLLIVTNKCKYMKEFRDILFLDYTQADYALLAVSNTQGSGDGAIDDDDDDEVRIPIYSPNKKRRLVIDEDDEDGDYDNDDDNSSTITESIGRTIIKHNGRRRSFDKRLRQLAMFKKKHKTTMVPFDYEGYNNLGRWVSTQRCFYKRFHEKKQSPGITEEGIRCLDELGFVWTMNGKSNFNYQKYYV
jgi:hypothetical protein